MLVCKSDLAHYLCLVLTFVVGNSSNTTGNTTVTPTNDTTVTPDDLTSTPATSINVTVSTQEPTVTPRPNSTATRSPDAVSVDSRRLYSLDPSERCACDLGENICDVNCCCDEECSKDEREAFSSCDDRFPEADDRYCSYIVARVVNATVIQRETVSSDSFLCIWKDNYKQRQYYKSVQVAKTKESFDGLIEMSRYELDDDDAANKAAAAKPLNIPVDSPSGWLELPFPHVSGICSDYLPIEYPRDEDHNCFRVLPDLAASCNRTASLMASSYHELNVTAAAQSTISTRLCSGDLGNCITPTKSVPDPEYNSSSNSCANVVSQLEYMITHNGPYNIKHVTAKFVLTDLPIAGKGHSMWLKQRFKVVFRFDNGSEFETFSGNPGYVVGHPVLALNQTSEDSSSGFLSVPVPLPGDKCEDGTFSPVSFGVNVVTSCTIQVTSLTPQTLCCRLREFARSILMDGLPTHVAAYGNATKDKTGDWVPLLVDDKVPAYLDSKSTCTAKSKKDACVDTVLGLGVEVTYVHVGFSHNRQAKIIGVLVRLAQPSDVPIRTTCTDASCNGTRYSLTTPVTVSVAFVDATEPPVAIFSPFPVFDVRLPHDFFYPYHAAASSRGSVSITCSPTLQCLSLLVCLLVTRVNF